MYSLTPINAINQVADVLSLHLPLTPQTAGLINKETIAKMKPKVGTYTCISHTKNLHSYLGCTQSPSHTRP